MPLSTPSHLAILGAGPTGLEAALAAVESRLSFSLFEAAPQIAAHVRAWGHVRLFSPWSLDVSPRMRRHLAAAGKQVPTGDSCPTGNELVELVLQPLALLPAIASRLRLGTRVVGISREGMLKHEGIGDPDRGRLPFRILLADDQGREWVEHADAVIDCTGTYGHPNSLGDGGIPAPGEGALEALISRQIPDFDAEVDTWSGRRILLVGGGHSAQTAAVSLAALAEAHPGTTVHWALRRPRPSWTIDPDDPLPERRRLVEEARRAADDTQGVKPMWGVVVEELRPVPGGAEVVLRREDGSTRTLEVDRIVSLTGFVGDRSLYRHLQVHECWATSGPMKLAATLLESSQDCLEQESHGIESLSNPEPGFYILGSKSYGRNSSFLMRIGWQQVDEVFGALAG